MKKIIAITGAILIAMTMFFSSNIEMNDYESIELTNLISLNTANAEPGGGLFPTVCKCNTYGKCKVNGAGDICANFKGNGFCSHYDSNCGYIQ